MGGAAAASLGSAASGFCTEPRTREERQLAALAEFVWEIKRLSGDVGRVVAPLGLEWQWIRVVGATA